MAENRSDPIAVGERRSTVPTLLLGAFLTLLTFVAGTFVVELLLDEPRARADAFASSVHYFNDLEDNARGEFMTAADNQRDAMEGLVHAMIDGVPAAEIRRRTERMKSTVEAYQRAGARLQALQNNYGPYFNAATQPDSVRALGVRLLASRYYIRDAMAAAGHFKLCLTQIAARYRASAPSAQANPNRVACRRSETVYLLYDDSDPDIVKGTDDESGELRRIDECEYGIAANMNFVASSLSSFVEDQGSATSLLVRAARWVHAASEPPPPAAQPVLPARDALEARCHGAADPDHHAMLPDTDPGGTPTDAAFHPFPLGAEPVQVAAPAPAADANPVQPAEFHP